MTIEEALVVNMATHRLTNSTRNEEFWTDLPKGLRISLRSSGEWVQAD